MVDREADERLNARETETEIFVCDVGVGYDRHYLDGIFKVFQQLRLTAEFEGTGIGPADVRRIINHHGGGTWAAGELDQGLTFFLS